VTALGWVATVALALVLVRFLTVVWPQWAAAWRAAWQLVDDGQREPADPGYAALQRPVPWQQTDPPWATQFAAIADQLADVDRWGDEWLRGRYPIPRTQEDDDR
jgi:hypothetical protein